MYKSDQELRELVNRFTVRLTIGKQTTMLQCKQYINHL